MTKTISVTNKWQIHIPAKMRQAIGWTKPSQVLISVQTKSNSLLIKPTKDSILDLAGSLSHLKSRKKIDIDNIRDYIDYSDL